MQRHVRAMLERLHPVSPVAFGLGPAVRDVLAYWRARDPSVTFDLRINPMWDHCDDDTREVGYRVVQEAVSNAMRHGRPRAVTVTLGHDGAALVVRVVDEGEAIAAAGSGGLGLEGMRQRVATLAGTLAAGPRPDGAGWAVEARLPTVAITADAAEARQ
jgi:two-component system sensor histidine kinase UhpB